jgi:hypothetical protein
MLVRIAILAVTFSLAACGSTDTGNEPDSGTPPGDGGNVQTDTGTTGGDGGNPVPTDGGQRDGFIIATDGSPQQDANTTLGNFSFFVTSLARIRTLSGSQSGFGGDLRYGFTGNGAGLKGADKICSDIAELSMPGAGTGKTWRAFLSVSVNANGVQENAIDRIGNGPWYDRLGRLFASSKANLLYDRPLDANATIKNDFPNEDGVPNHNPDGTGQVDNHDTITGSNDQGKLYSSTAHCKNWTAKAGTSDEGSPRVGHSWPRSGGGGGGDMANWMSSLDEAGCKPGVNLIETGPPDPSTHSIGSGGGYGGFYCFALTP